MTASDVTVESLTVRYGGLTAIEDVSLSIEDGEFFTLVGPSGCGKTTMLRAIAGLEPPATGEIAIGGEPVTDEPPEARDVGIVFQSYALFPHMTVRENVGYGLQFHAVDGDDDERVAELLELVGLAELADREPAQLSGGQRQRVALARALAPEPDVLLLDEPLSALDAKLRKRLRVQIRAIQRDLGITTVYVTHDQAEALAISDRVAVVHDGAIEQVATPETVYRQPASRFVAEFVGDTNVFTGVVTGDGTAVEVGGAALPVPADAAIDAGERAALSVRPEAISVAEPADSGERAGLSATVDTVEFLGDAYRLHCEWDGRTVVVKTGAEQPPDGAVTLRFDGEDTRVFEPEGGETRNR